MAPATPIKLRARDAEDMAVIAAWLQDALVPVVDMAYLPREKRFVMVVNRFCWENSPAGAPPQPVEPVAAEAEGDASFTDADDRPPYRVNCGLCFDRVRAVKLRGFELRQKDQILNLLTIETRPREIVLHFSDDAAIRLEVGMIACHLEDLGEPWPTRWRPDHDLDQAPSA